MSCAERDPVRTRKNHGRMAAPTPLRVGGYDGDWVEHGMPVVQRVALRYAGHGISLDELMGAGRLGLVEAAQRFDARRGTSFATYATWWVRKRVLDALLLQSRTVAPSRYRLEQQRNLGDVRDELARRGERVPDVDRLADHAQLSERVARRAIAQRIHVVSLDDNGGGDGETPGERLVDDDSRDPLALAIHRQGVRRVRALLQEIPERDREILSWRYGLAGEEPLSSQRVGDRVGLSRERVRQIERKWLRWLRARIGVDATPA